MIEKAVIDRFDGDLAVLLIGEDGSRRLDVPRTQLPKGAQEGMWLKIDLEGDALRSIATDLEETERAKQRIAEKLDRLRRGLHRKDKNQN